jgi:hypothetical protein
MATREEYECAVSGLTAEGEDLGVKDDLGTLPRGWTRITLERREYNPKYAAVQDLKQAMVENIVKQFPEEQRELQALAVALQVDAQFHPLIETTKEWLVIKEVVYLSPGEGSSELRKVINDLRETLDLEPTEWDEDADPNERAEVKP